MKLKETSVSDVNQLNVSREILTISFTQKKNDNEHQILPYSNHKKLIASDV